MAVVEETSTASRTVAGASSISASGNGTALSGVIWIVGMYESGLWPHLFRTVTHKIKMWGTWKTSIVKEAPPRK